jgi:nucleotide-binding universal stress UspA family protein
MSKPIMVAVALRDDDAAPLALGRVLARLTGAPLALVSTYPYGASPLFAFPEWTVAMRERAHADLTRLAARHSREFEVTVHVLDETPIADALRDTALDLEAAAIVVGSTHRGPAGRVLAGEVAKSLLHGAPCPVAVAPRDYREPAAGVSRIGVAFVDTAEGRVAFSTGAALARRCHTTLTAFTVTEPLGWSALVEPGWSFAGAYDEVRRGHAEEAAAAAGKLIPYGVRASCEVLTGAPSVALGEVSHGLDLLVCGSRGHGALSAVALGSVSRGLIRSAACPLLVVPRTADHRLLQLLSRPAGALAA